MAILAKGGFIRAATEEMQQLMTKPHTEIRDEKKGEVELPGHNKVKAAMERHTVMVYRNHTAG
jgi:hypothetical protein